MSIGVVVCYRTTQPRIRRQRVMTSHYTLPHSDARDLSGKLSIPDVGIDLAPSDAATRNDRCYDYTVAYSRRRCCCCCCSDRDRQCTSFCAETSCIPARVV